MVVAPGLTRAEVHAADRKPVPAVVPLELELTAPDGKRVWRIYRATRDGAFAERWPLGRSPMRGEYTLRVTERLSGKFAVQKVAVTPEGGAKVADAIGTVERLDAAKIAKLLQPGRELLILIGDERHHETEAERLVAALAKRRVTATVGRAKEYLGKDKLDNPKIKGQEFPFFNGVFNYAVGVHRDVIVLGSAADNPLMQKLVKGYDLAPWKLRDDDPGPGRAVVWWAAAAFGLDHQIVAVYAADAPGLARGIDAAMESR